MQKIWSFFLILCVVSCNLNNSKASKKKEFVAEALDSINWDDVEVYPLFYDCNEDDKKVIQRQCFETTLINHLIVCLEKTNLEVDNDIADIIKVDFIIKKTGVISVSYIEKKPYIDKLLPNLREVISKCLSSLPRVEPALVRGREVDSKFKLPIIINVR